MYANSVISYAFFLAKKATPRAAVSVATRAAIGVASPVVVAPVVSELLELDDELELLELELFELELFELELFELDEESLDELSAEDGSRPKSLATLALTSSQLRPVSTAPSSFQLNNVSPSASLLISYFLQKLSYRF